MSNDQTLAYYMISFVVIQYIVVGFVELKSDNPYDEFYEMTWIFMLPISITITYLLGQVMVN